MRITSKTLMIGFETEVKLGSNDAIELTLVHQAYIGKGKDGEGDIDLDLSMDITDVKFLGIEIEPGYKSFKKFKEQLKDLGIDLNKLVNEKEKELIDDGLEEKLKLMFKDKI
jgi:hypothetical protein